MALTRYEAVGVLESIFHFAYAYARRGDIGRFSDSTIADSIGWQGDAAELMRALVGSGWIDPCCDAHRLRIHDWDEHADQATQKTKEVESRGFLECYKDSRRISKGQKKIPLSHGLAGKGRGKGKVEVKEQGSILLGTPLSRTFEYWCRVMDHADAKLTDKREKAVLARLERDKYTEEQLRLAIDGCKASPYHQGQNDNGTVYDDLELICRSGEKVEGFMARARRLPAQTRDEAIEQAAMEFVAETEGRDAGHGVVLRGRDGEARAGIREGDGPGEDQGPDDAVS